MSKLVELQLPGNAVSNMTGGCVSLTQNAYYLPCESLKNPPPPNSEIYIIDSLQGDRIRDEISNKSPKGGSINVMCCQSDENIIFNGYWQGLDGTQKFYGLITYAGTEKQSFTNETYIDLPYDLKINAFYNATYDIDNEEIYFRATTESGDGTYVVIDAKNKTYKKSIKYPFGSDNIADIDTAVSKYRRLYIEHQTDLLSDCEIMCYDDATDTYIDSIIIEKMDGYALEFGGMAVDNAKDILYVVMSYARKNSFRHTTVIKKYNLKDNAFIEEFNAEDDVFYSNPVINSRMQLMYVNTQWSIQVIDLKKQTVINTIEIPKDERDPNNGIVKIDYNPISNCIIASVFKGEPGTMECYIDTIYNPEEVN